MLSDSVTLPDNVEALKEIVHNLRDRYEEEIKFLREQIRHLRSKLYGRKSEKHVLPPDAGEQLLLFDEPCVEESCDQQTIEVPSHRRRKPGRKPLPADLPRVDVIHDLKDEDKVCDCGAVMDRIGEEVSERLDIVPAKMTVIRHVRYKYACKQCEGVESESSPVKTAPLPAQLVEKGIATPGLIAHVLTAKFVDAVPFYRQEKQFARIGVDVSRANMSNWAIKAAEICRPLLELLREEILSCPLINIDETTVRVLNEPGRLNTSKSYMWLFRGEKSSKTALEYQYHPSRSGDVAADYLDGFAGYVQTDGYSGYDFLDRRPGITHVGCFAHVRRKFKEAADARPKSAKGKLGSADEALSYIRRLYAIEHSARNRELTPEQLLVERRDKGTPVLEEFKAWLDKKSVQTPPTGLLGQAVTYALSQWDRLIRYVEDPLLRPDNNLAENAIRPFVVGRKNWLFSGNPEGARAGATLYSLIETAKANGLEPYKYLRYLFEKLASAGSTEDYRALLPQNLSKDIIALPA